MSANPSVNLILICIPTYLQKDLKWITILKYTQFNVKIYIIAYINIYIVEKELRKHLEGILL